MRFRLRLARFWDKLPFMGWAAFWLLVAGACLLTGATVLLLVYVLTLR